MPLPLHLRFHLSVQRFVVAASVITVLIAVFTPFALTMIMTIVMIVTIVITVSRAHRQIRNPIAIRFPLSCEFVLCFSVSALCIDVAQEGENSGDRKIQ